jgi:RsiW-degrading membrane proteinase PrsW (M82 family)
MKEQPQHLKLVGFIVISRSIATGKPFSTPRREFMRARCRKRVRRLAKRFYYKMVHVLSTMGTLEGNKISLSVHRPRLQEKLFFLLSGIITSVPLTLFVGTFADSLCVSLPIFYAQVCSIAIFTPFVEEFAKAFPLFYRHGETTKSLFSLGFIVGLGFGFTEFLLYVFALDQPILVRLPGIFFHAASTSITAYGIGTNRPWAFYLIAVGLHFVINFAALFSSMLMLIGSAAIVVTYYLSWNIYKRTSETFPEKS